MELLQVQVLFKASLPTIKLSRLRGNLPKEVEGKYMEHYTSSSHGKNEWFVPICDFCHVKWHLWPRCFKLMKYIKKVVSSYDNPDMLLNLNFAPKVTSLDLFGLGNLN